MNHFKIIKRAKKSPARAGVLKTAHGRINTPFFMPVATQGTVKHLSSEEIKKLGAEIILANTYHLLLRPGAVLIKKMGGLHNYVGWPGPILTDSGGFQVFSLASPVRNSSIISGSTPINHISNGAGNKKRSGENLVKLTAAGVKFKSYVDGRNFKLTPENSLKLQIDFGVDIAVCLDECVALPAKKEYLAKSVELTGAWAKRSKAYYDKLKGKKPLLFAVIQGGLNKELRLKSLNDLLAIGFDGYNIGGLSVGETEKEMFETLDYLVPLLPTDKPRYLMGVGYPEQIIKAVKYGVDMFDCVIPTREGRHGRLFLWKKNVLKKSIVNCQLSKAFYKTINITNSKFAADKTLINPGSRLPELRTYSRAYLNYLFKINEPLGARLATLNNLEFYLDLMEKIRQAIRRGEL